MSSRLDRVKDWAAVATGCGYQVHEVARRVGCSERQVERYFRKRFGVSPKGWMDSMRMGIATERILQGEMVKVVASELHFKQRPSFSKFFKRHEGAAPTNYGVRS